MKSGGSSRGRQQANPQPNANVTGYGAASPFNPQYTSFLPEDAMSSAQLGDQSRTEYGAPTPLLEQQQATPMVASTSSSSGISDPMKKFLAELMARADRDKYLTRVNKESAGGGSAASGSFSGSAFGGGGASGGLY